MGEMEHAVQTDSKGRINLGTAFASQFFLVEEIEPGEFLFKKASVIPERELWLHRNQEAKTEVLKGLEEAKSGKLIKNAVRL